MLGIDVKGVDQIELSTGFPVGSINAYLVFGEKLTLVDTGSNLSSNWTLLTKALQERNLTIHDIDQVLLTHHHVDHVGLLDRIQEVHPIPVLGHANGRPWLSQDPVFMEWNLEFFGKLVLEWGTPKDLWNQVKKDFSKMMENLSCHSQLNIELVEGDTVPGLSEWKVIETPGHAQSHLAFYREKDQVLIAGDHILKHISSNPQYEPPIDPNEERAKALIQYTENLKKCAEIPIDAVLTGHGSYVKNVSNLVNKRLMDTDKRASHIKSMIQNQYKSGYEIVNELFSPKVVRQQLKLTVSETIGHIDLLQERREIEEKWVNGIKCYRAI